MRHTWFLIRRKTLKETVFVQYKREDMMRGHGIVVEIEQERLPWASWYIWPDYEIFGHGADRYLLAPESSDQLEGRDRYYPLSRRFSDLFLRFARWPEKHAMTEAPLDSEENERAAYEWAKGYGVLGVDPPEIEDRGLSLGAATFRNGGRGGPEETITRFADEAWQAHRVLRLFEAATDPDGPDVAALAALMPDRDRTRTNHRGEKRPVGDWTNHRGENRTIPTVRELHGQEPWAARGWALDVVEETVERKVRGRCWPVPVRGAGSPGQGVPDRGGASHAQGWAFENLLGVMWLQMMFLMIGQPRRCEWCGKVLPENARRGARFCQNNNGACKSKWNYHHGDGKSSKAGKERARQSR